MQNNIMFVPGQQFRIFEVHRKVSTMDAKGCVTYGSLQPVGTVKGSISIASQKDMERFKQNEHPITHTIVAQLKVDVRAEDVLIRDGVKHFVQGVDDPSGLGFYTIIHCERKDGV